MYHTHTKKTCRKNYHHRSSVSCNVKLNRPSKSPEMLVGAVPVKSFWISCTTLINYESYHSETFSISMTPIFETGWDLFLFSFRGAFINHVDHILHNFDLPNKNGLYTLCHVTSRGLSTNPPPPSSCPRCYLMPPSKSIWFKCAF